MRRQRLEVGPDLVGDVPGPRDPVGANDREVDPPVLHQMPARIVADNRVRHPVLTELPRSQRRTLIARPRLVDPDMHRHTGIVRGIDRRERGPPIDRREPPGVAMRQYLHRRITPPCSGQQGYAMGADGLVLCHVFLRDCRRLGIGIGRAVVRPAVA